jgi:formylglycine-generating enzyme required for sulfatase activity
LLLIAVLAAGVAIARSLRDSGDAPPSANLDRAFEVVEGMVRIPAGRLHRGDLHEPGEPVAEFWLDRHEVTNRQFAAFVAATGYRTTTEQVGSAHIFDPAEHRWRTVADANWRRPGGPFTSTIGREEMPVVLVSWHDAAAYARWAEKRLPTAVEWEYAARGGLYDSTYPWGREELSEGKYQANYWQGWFPDEDRGLDGFRDLAPVGSFPPNRFGLCDMSGNVWEWCLDWSTPAGVARSGPPTERIRRGGSWLCSENYSRGIELATQSAAPPHAASNHVGFRCARDARE